MSHKNETLSAFVDAELTKAENKEQISEATSDVNARYRLQRYQLIGDMMRGETGDAVQLDFAAQVSAKIALLEPLTKSSKLETEKSSEGFFSQWLKPLGGLAVAASVAWVAVISLQSLSNVESLTGEFTQKADEIAQVVPQADVSEQVNRLAQLPVAANVLTVSTPVLMQRGNHSQWTTAQSHAVSQTKLNAYLVTHTEFSPSMKGLMPQARVAGFDVNPK